MCDFVKPSTVETYLSGITYHLHPLYPNVKHNDDLDLCLYSTPIHHKLPLSFGQLEDLAIWLINRRKTLCRNSVHITDEYARFTLPASKTDRFFSANDILLKWNHHNSDPVINIARYLLWQDCLFPEADWLWLTSASVPPSQTWFLYHFHQFFSKDYGGHSLCTGGAILLARMGIDFNLIQALGHWSSDTFHTYIHQHPLIIHEAHHP
ncbi:hypothetical protein P691DRAFT_796738 [Macrolepiota fuliginosa MF-IS2]|uniref:Uncharacterized protein n=1 Tax=Macrolepiota fuliginosa MF-IS2 TaxID=1400762 RepID=A0A9P5WVS6_9AGAR|nr:hypothetical protein P691DRAFT_796738 [Macrolepiota fuliginosa MF-IS2]